MKFVKKLSLVPSLFLVTSTMAHAELVDLNFASTLDFSPSANVAAGAYNVGQ